MRNYIQPGHAITLARSLRRRLRRRPARRLDLRRREWRRALRRRGRDPAHRRHRPRQGREPGLDRRRQGLLGQHREAGDQRRLGQHAHRRGGARRRRRRRRDRRPGAAQRRLLSDDRLRRPRRPAVRRSEPRAGCDLEPADGEPVSVRVVARRADAVTEFGGGRLWSETTRLRPPRRRGGEPAAGRPDRDRRRGLRRAGRAGAGPRAAGLDARGEAGMRLTIDIRPDLAALMAAEIAAGERAVTAAVREAGAGLKLGWRGQITGAGLGARLANSIRSEVFPKAGASLNAAAVVWSKAPVIIGAHDAGPLIRARNGLWLAIPTPAAGQGARRAADHAGGVGAEDRAQAAVRLSADAGRACSSRRRDRGPQARRRRRSSCWCRRSSCRSGSTWRGTPSGRTTRCRG